MLTSTQWTLVFRAAQEDQRSQRPAMSQLIEKYWQPLYFFARRQGMSAADAEDATQAFLSELIDGKALAAADPAKGRFRNYLLTIWKRFLIDRARSENAAKRGGDVAVTSIYYGDGEKAWLTYSTYTKPDHDADRAYFEEWASTLVRNALDQVRLEYVKSQREITYQALLPHLTAPIKAGTYAELAQKLGVSLGAAKVALHRLRQRFALTLRHLVQETVEDPEELDVEIEELKRYLETMKF